MTTEPATGQQAPQKLQASNAAIWLAVISAISSVLIAWITARGTARGTTQDTIHDSKNQLSALNTETQSLKQQITSAKAEALPSVPPGTIVAWFNRDAPVPEGWAVCNGTQNTPDLRGRFLRGTSDQADVGTKGGDIEHSHEYAFNLPEDGRKASDKDWGDTPWRTGPNPARGTAPVTGTTKPASSLPPYYNITYIMKK